MWMQRNCGLKTIRSQELSVRAKCRCYATVALIARRGPLRPASESAKTNCFGRPPPANIGYAELIALVRHINALFAIS